MWHKQNATAATLDHRKTTFQSRGSNLERIHKLRKRQGEEGTPIKHRSQGLRGLDPCRAESAPPKSNDHPPSGDTPSMHEDVSPEGQLAHPLSHGPARTRTVSRAGLSPTPAEDSSLRPQETQPPQQALSRRQTARYMRAHAPTR